VTQLLCHPLLFSVNVHFPQQLEVAKGSKKEADLLHWRCCFAARLPLVRLNSAVTPMILRPTAGLRRVLTGVSYSPSGSDFQKVAPIERLANFGDRKRRFDARSGTMTCLHVLHAFGGAQSAKGCLEFSNF
jgi:hypothetical protein